jgi:hypothetical protein
MCKSFTKIEGHFDKLPEKDEMEMPTNPYFSRLHQQKCGGLKL